MIDKSFVKFERFVFFSIDGFKVVNKVTNSFETNQKGLLVHFLLERVYFKLSIFLLLVLNSLRIGSLDCRCNTWMERASK